MNLTSELAIIQSSLDGLFIPMYEQVEMAIKQGIKRQKGYELFNGPHSTIFIRVCMKCNCTLGTKNAMDMPGGESHGICDDCLKNHY